MQIKTRVLFIADLVNIFSCLPGNNGPLLHAVGQHHNVSWRFCCVCWGFLGFFCNRYRRGTRVLLRIIYFLFSLYVTSLELGYCTSHFHLGNTFLWRRRAQGNKTTKWQHKRKRAVENETHKPERHIKVLSRCGQTNRNILWDKRTSQEPSRRWRWFWIYAFYDICLFVFYFYMMLCLLAWWCAQLARRKCCPSSLQRQGPLVAVIKEQFATCVKYCFILHCRIRPVLCMFGNSVVKSRVLIIWQYMWQACSPAVVAVWEDVPCLLFS